MSNEKLTDQEVNEISEILENNTSEKTKKLREIMNTPAEGIYPTNVIADKPELLEGKAILEIDPETGVRNIKSVTEDETIRSEVDLDSLINDTANVKYGESLKKELIDNLDQNGITDDIRDDFITLLLDYHAGNKKNVFARMPSKVQGMIRMMAGSNNIAELNSSACLMLDQFIADCNFDAIFTDFQNALDEELKSVDGNIMDMYGEHLKEQMQKLKEIAESQKDSNPKLYEKRIKIYNAYEDACTFTSLYNALENGDKITKRLDKDISRFSRIVTSFDYKYNSQTKYNFRITSISVIPKVISRLFPEYDSDMGYKFAILFYRYVMNFSPEVLEEHAFMYYTISTIINAEYYAPESESYKQIHESLGRVLEKINNI